jgi:hypothetical protein
MTSNQYFNQINNLLFWDSKKEDLILEKDSFYIIKRVIIQGDKKDRDLLFKIYKKEEIKDVISNTREMTPQLKKIWLNVLN